MEYKRPPVDSSQLKYYTNYDFNNGDGDIDGILNLLIDE